MELSRKQFDVLEILAGQKEPLRQRQLEGFTDYSLGTVNRVYNELVNWGFVSDGIITPEGLEALEPYRVKRAVFIAAGFGTRLMPVTLNTPKPLVRVNGKRIIDGLIDACIGIGIQDIVIVRGYLAEQFDQLLYKYPMLKFIENSAYNEANNISSAMCARFLLANSYVFEADLLLNNPKIIKKYHYSSNYLGIKKERTDDWCFKMKDGYISSQQIGGVDCYQEVGISYWNEADGKKLAEHIKQAYETPGGKELYWDQAQFGIFKGEYKVEVRECDEKDVIEIDTFNELKSIDKSYNI
ncbi:MAG: NTP transferase domain-containing protein [Sphaerochaetaceae bacterium]|nr:NTP transferase domain-containing protein [Sphaerochaetaceae bacterium]